MSNRRRGNTRTRRSELQANGTASRAPRTIPLVYLNFVIGLFLLGPAWISTQTFFTCFRHAAVHHRFWASDEFWFFGLGVVMWLIVFFALPRPLVIYVFGHELTHALWVWMMGGRVSDFHVSREGGHIISDKHNVWIAWRPIFSRYTPSPSSPHGGRRRCSGTWSPTTGGFLDLSEPLGRSMSPSPCG